MNTEACKNEEMVTGTAPRQPKFQVLLDAASGINGVIEHLNELNRVLGVQYETQTPKNDAPKNPNEPSLLRALNELPEELSQAHSLIHDMINTIMNELN